MTLQAPHEVARLRGLVLVVDHRGNVADVGVDGVAEQHELHHRQARHHRERRAVTTQLEQLLPGDGQEARHDELPSLRMPFLLRPHHGHEGILHVGARGVQLAEGDAVLLQLSAHEALRIVAAAHGHPHHIAQERDLIDHFAARAARPPPARSLRIPLPPPDRLARFHDLARCAHGQHLTTEDEGQAMAALCLVHVVSGHDDRGALGGHAMDLIPELTAAHGIDARGRLVQEEAAAARARWRRPGPRVASSRPTRCPQSARGARPGPCARAAPRCAACVGRRDTP